MKISSDFVQDSDTYIAMATLGTIFPLIREIILESKSGMCKRSISVHVLQ
jgi:hypothetical protein